MSPRRIIEEPVDPGLTGNHVTAAPENGPVAPLGEDGAAIQAPPPPPPQVTPQNQRPSRRNMIDMAQLDAETLSDLRERARDMAVSGYSRLKKDDLIIRLLQAQAEKQGLELRGGVLDVVDDNIGFLRAEHYLPGPDDIYVSARRRFKPLRAAHRGTW